MKAIGVFCKNHEERDQARDLDMPIPEFIPDYEEIYIDLDFVASCFKNDEGNINILIQGTSYNLKWDEKVWNELIEKFN